MKHDLPSFAVLIDADNVKLESIAPILEEITRIARITVRRVYGDFTSQNLAAWKTKLAEHAIHPIQQYRNTIGKNSSDSALIIDAMDLLHSRRFEGFCLVSSDSDFTRLATRIREDGLVVYGFGEKKAPKAFVNACDRYTYVENLIVVSPPAQSVESTISLVTENLMTQPDSLESSPANQTAQLEKQSSKPFLATEAIKAINKPPLQASNLLLRAYTNVTDDHGWAMIGSMSSYIHANHSDFDPRSFGCAKFIDLIQRTDAFELIQRAHKNGQSYFCRPKPSEQEPTGTHAYLTALLKAVAEAKAPNGWAPISVIGQKLKALGHDISKSGFSTLTEALKATSLFEMQGSGAARYFRAKI
ncbi:MULTISPECIES: NYN domain-containing protein [unclassified Candidatus Accumulibacter]|uniref:NYN domain-containing protein n=1 Tax=unclassified Candidatus Accumulibacter TaxID=2619054 RepID=UPI0025C141E9|nr:MULTISPECIES: NYN domain-containing protein [unclassified Candidatus Accumulibacter]